MNGVTIPEDEKARKHAVFEAQQRIVSVLLGYFADQEPPANLPELSNDFDVLAEALAVSEQHVADLREMISTVSEQLGHVQNQLSKASGQLANVSGALADSGVVVPGDAWFYGAAVTQVSNAAALLRREVESERRRADWNEQRWRTVAQLYDKERDQRQQAEAADALRSDTSEVQQLKLYVADLESFRDRSEALIKDLGARLTDARNDRDEARQSAADALKGRGDVREGVATLTAELLSGMVEELEADLGRVAAERDAALALCARAVKYAREDRMRTPGKTRLQRVLDEMARTTGRADGTGAETAARSILRELESLTTSWMHPEYGGDCVDDIRRLIADATRTTEDPTP